MSIRHPEKINNPINPIKKKPSWIRTRILDSQNFFKTKEIINKKKLHTVCQEASCPNISECWSKRHATFMIMGDTCTRACAFCDVKTGKPKHLDLMEPLKIAQATRELNLKHVVITSVDRDDLSDGGALQFRKSILAIKKLCLQTTVEVLTPDFQRKDGALEIVISAEPDVLNHNLETIPRLYKTVRRGANYEVSLNLLANVKKIDSNIFTKSGIMLGLGESIKEVEDVLEDLRKANVDFVTIGQYLQPTISHLPVKKYVSPDQFKYFESLAYKKGFSMVSSSPLTRSSYHADQDFENLKINKININNATITND